MLILNQAIQEINFTGNLRQDGNTPKASNTGS